MPDPISDLPQFPGSSHDPGRPPPRRGWSPVAVGLAAVAAVAGLATAVAAFGDPTTRGLFLVGWMFLTWLGLKCYGLWLPDDE